MKKTYCTIITADYIHYALALNYSLLKYSDDVELKVLISDNDITLLHVEEAFPNIEIFYAKELCKKGLPKKIRDKYFEHDMDCFRWSMKPVLINYLLNQGYEQVFFLDSDLYFYGSYDFLSIELEPNSVLLNPHWRASDPADDEVNFSVLQTSGIYNAGFIGVRKSGIPAMDWWAKVCEFKCIKSPKDGLFVDQAYLDLLHIYFDGVKNIKHRGCNIANWNQIECRRRISPDGRVRINNNFDIIFIHFTESTIEGIKNGTDALLKPHLEEYFEVLKRFRKWVSNNDEYNETKTSLPNLNKPDKSPVNSTIYESFLYPRCTPNNLDRYIVRTSILNSLKKDMDKLSGTLLDVGCGKMPYKSIIISQKSKVENYLGLDYENNSIYGNKPDITWLNERIPLSENSIDCAICTEVLEHCSDPGLVLSEIYRVLKPGGILLLTVPFLWPLHEVPNDEYRYTPYSLQRHLNEGGFNNIQLKPLGGWDASLGQILGLWVRRSQMSRYKRFILSYFFTPIIWWLYRKDRKAIKTFRESLMVTGLYGLAKK